MIISGEKVQGVFIKRLNRFEAHVQVNGEVCLAHVPNTGRLKELLIEGVKVILRKSENPNRKTAYSLMFVYKGDHLICIDSILANRVFEESFQNNLFELHGDIRREIPYRDSRIDFFINDVDPTLVEVKCCTHEQLGIASFPDAPTTRGQKHVKELMKAVQEGFRACIYLLTFMDYVEEFTPNDGIDPVFGSLLREAVKCGVEVKAYSCRITPDEIVLHRELKIVFDNCYQMKLS